MKIIITRLFGQLDSISKLRREERHASIVTDGSLIKYRASCNILFPSIKGRINIVFRGSVTMRDLAADIDPLMGWFSNPVESVRGYSHEEFLGIQLGFAGMYAAHCRAGAVANAIE